MPRYVAGSLFVAFLCSSVGAQDAPKPMEQANQIKKALADLKSPKDVDRSQAVSQLRQLRAKEHTQTIAALLSDTSFLVRREVVYTLSKWRANEYRKEIAALLKDSDVRGTAAHALGMMQAAEFAKEVASLLKVGNAVERGVAAWALGKMQAKEYSNEIIPLLREKEISARSYAVLSLALMGMTEYHKEAGELLNEKDFVYQMRGIEALGHMKAKDYADRIVPLVGDKNAYIRWHAFTAAVRIAAGDLAKHAAVLLNHKNPSVRADAVRFLGMLGAKEHRDAVAALSNDFGTGWLFDVEADDTEIKSVSQVVKKVLGDWSAGRPPEKQASTPGELYGTVFEAGKREGVWLVTVAYHEKAELTEKDGSYCLKDLPAGIAEVHFVYGDSVVVYKNVKIAAGKRTRINASIKLERGRAIVEDVIEPDK